MSGRLNGNPQENSSAGVSLRASVPAPRPPTSSPPASQCYPTLPRGVRQHQWRVLALHEAPAGWAFDRNANAGPERARRQGDNAGVEEKEGAFWGTRLPLV
ncbi:hypothetical protein VFPFJ_01906 [Purpureocillium lilacinum]|nr:hypothetical protein VFPFJ_01906 [Purpureocillium lilacinum]OAQ71678.1 hypothetical protein VFPBJ_10457 [Purpureocillium lilacinum]OAQ92745.1 hypothetical protein VFPFJ_01906 [Purpureocillium lilacinum]